MGLIQSFLACVRSCNQDQPVRAPVAEPVLEPVLAAVLEPVLAPVLAPGLQLTQLSFNSLVVDCDTKGEFDRIWCKNRLNVSANVGGSIQNNSVLCYAGGTSVTITATFTVTGPFANPNVLLEGIATIDDATSLRWDAVMSVEGGGSTVTATMTSEAKLPSVVGCYDPVRINWTVTWEGTTTHFPTEHLLYTLLPESAGISVAAPVGAAQAEPSELPLPDRVDPIFWTLLDMTCRPAHGMSTANDLVTQSYDKLKACTRDGNGPKRARDKKQMAYWWGGSDITQADTAKDLLADTKGDGKCGAWADLLFRMFAIHHVKAKVLTLWPVVVRSEEGADPPVHSILLVEKGAVALGNSYPPYAFKNHAVVQYDEKIYDPSYGLEPQSSLKNWEKAALNSVCDWSTAEAPLRLITLACGRPVSEPAGEYLKRWPHSADPLVENRDLDHDKVDAIGRGRGGDAKEDSSSLSMQVYEDPTEPHVVQAVSTGDEQEEKESYQG